MSEFELLRELLTIEEKFHAVRRIFEGYALDPTPETVLLDKLIADTRHARHELERFFAE